MVRGGSLLRRTVVLRRQGIIGWRVSQSLFQRSAYWDVLMEVVAAAPPAYAGDSYRDRSDRFLREFTRAEADRLRAASDAVRFSTLRDHIQAAAFVQADLYVTR